MLIYIIIHHVGVAFENRATVAFVSEDDAYNALSWLNTYNVVSEDYFYMTKTQLR